MNANTTPQYTVTFNANDGSANPATGSQTFTAGTAQALKTAATLGFSKANYTFAGWATSKEASSAAYADGASYTATENVTLYAVWTAITYTVTFNANDGSANPATETQAFTAGTAQALKTAATLNFSRTNYAFAGWATTNDATSATLADGTSYTATENVTLYAVWKTIDYTVTFNANDGSANPATGTQTFTAGTAQVLKTAATLGFSKTNYTFAGWATTNDATSAAYADGASFTATENVTLYAVWKIIDYTVTFNANDGSESPATATQAFTAGTAQALKTAASLNFSKTNYTFAGWATSSDASSAAYTDGASYIATENVTLYAVWTAITYTVTFNANDGSANPATATQVFTAGSAQALKTAASLGFSRANYTFAGWATTNDATSATLADEASYTATENVTLYAVWTAITYTVTFNANDGSANPATATQVFTAGSAQALKTAAALVFSKANYTFAGWATSNSATSAAYADGASYTATENVTLYAVWTAITYTVTFNANDGSANPATGTQTFTAGTAQALTTASNLGFSRSGYSFAGWAATNDATSAAYTDGASYTATENVTLYAVWTAITLSSISVNGTPNFSVTNVFFAGKTASSYGLTVTATYSNSTTTDVSSTATITSTVSNTAGNVTVTYTEGGVTKTAEVTGSYYVAASDALTQTVIDNGKTTIDSKSFQLVKFGDFPQTIAASGITYSSSTVYNGWYLGSDGYFYESCSANPYTDDSNYTCSDGTTLVNGTTYYFKVQPIEWRVLKTDNDARTKLLFAEKILTANVPYYYSDDLNSHYRADATGVYGNNYKYSQIRAYLNGLNYYNDSNTAVTTYNNNGFLQKAFTTSAQNLIPATAVDNSARSTNPESNAEQWENGENPYACANTSDKIFLLSEQEVTRSDYGFAAYNVIIEVRRKVTTDYAKANNAYTCESCDDWWLRSPGYNGSNLARDVTYNGHTLYGNIYVFRSEQGVCPALSISF